MTDEKIPETYNELLLATQPQVIHDDDEYQRQLGWIDRIMTAEDSTPSNEPRIRIMELLVSTVINWEEEVSSTPTPTVSAREMLVHTMEARGLSQTGLAKQLEVSPQLISAIVRGERAIARGMSRKLADLFDHPINFYIDTDTKSKQVSHRYQSTRRVGE